MKVWFFRLITLLIPVLFFVCLELGLRLADYGNDYPLFIENPDSPDYILPRPDLVKRYFPRQSDIPSVTIEANFLRQNKPDNGLRFFVQGGSTAAGFPYGLSASLAGMLDHRLKQSFPRHYVEVINTALSAVNSYTVLDTVDEIIEQQPDAVFIYMGHNEYLGILGVGSNYTAANSQSTTLLFLKLKSLRIFQLIQQLYHLMQSPKAPLDSEQSSRTFMAKVAKHKSIEIDSELFTAGVDQFDTNLQLILSKYQNAGIPVFISTLTSNLLDQAPFSSAPMASNLQNQLQQLKIQALQGQMDASLLATITQSVATSQSALAHYSLGKLFYALNDAQKAQQHLLRAKELDLLRFRAPEKINHIIRSKAGQNGVFLVDSQRRFEQRSKLGVVGNNLMLEHLHPNLQGYFLLSDAFYQRLKDSNQFADFKDVPTALAWRQRLVLPSEEYFGYAKVQQLKADYPFEQKPIQISLPAPVGWEQQLGLALYNKQIDWLAMVKTAQQYYRAAGDHQQWLKTQFLLADAIPYDQRINQQTLDLLEHLQQTRLQPTYHQRLTWSMETPHPAKMSD